MSVMVLQGHKSTPQKSRPLESGHRRYGVRLAIKYSYKLGQKMNLNFSANMAGFCRDSHILVSDVLMIGSTIGNQFIGPQMAFAYSSIDHQTSALKLQNGKYYYIVRT